MPTDTNTIKTEGKGRIKAIAWPCVDCREAVTWNQQVIDKVRLEKVNEVYNRVETVKMERWNWGV